MTETPEIDSEKVILLVEDNPDDEELTIRAFRMNRILNKIVVAHDGAEALDVLFSRGAYAGDAALPRPPELVLLDLNLPLVSGLDVLKQLRADERTACLAVVVLTSSKEDEDIVTSYKRGANAYVRKPVKFQAFVKAAEKIGLFWLVVNEPAPMRKV